MINIRSATNLDHEEVRKVHLSAFSDDEKQMVSKLAVNLLSEKTDPETISLVAETNGVLVGHIAFSPVTIENGKDHQGYILAPLGIVPGYQSRRIGTELIEQGIEQLSKMGVTILFVYGDPEYYGKFGFNTDLASKYVPPFELQYPFGWQAITLNENNLDKAVVRISCVASLHDPRLW